MNYLYYSQQENKTKHCGYNSKHPFSRCSPQQKLLSKSNFLPIVKMSPLPGGGRVSIYFLKNTEFVTQLSTENHLLLQKRSANLDHLSLCKRKTLNSPSEQAELLILPRDIQKSSVSWQVLSQLFPNSLQNTVKIYYF